MNVKTMFTLMNIFCQTFEGPRIRKRKKDTEIFPDAIAMMAEGCTAQLIFMAPTIWDGFM